MTHPKMQYTYVGIDSHKDTHTAVFLDCFFEKLGALTFPNRPSQFDAFLAAARPYLMEGTRFLFGLEDSALFGRSLNIFLRENGHPVKHVNSLLVAQERKNQAAIQKTDDIDAECAARVLLSKFSTLPDATTHDRYWVLRTLVLRRSALVKTNKALKNQLHAFLTQHYPAYRSYFFHIESKTALAFFMRYPSPGLLKDTTPEELAAMLELPSRGMHSMAKAKQILSSLEDTAVEMQQYRDVAVQSIIRQLQFNLGELDQLEATLTQLLDSLGTTLLTMKGLNTPSAAQLLSCIGDISRFATPAKLARYAGIAPITYASGKKDQQFTNQRGNRELNHVIYNLALRVSMEFGSKKIVLNHYFHEYYRRKISEGKTKRQAIKCVMRRLVTIIWGMLTHGVAYVNPPAYRVSDTEA